MKKSLLMLGGLGLGAYLLTRGYNTVNAVKRLEYTNPQVKVGKLSLGGLALEMKMDFINSTSESISIEYFSGVIIYQGSNLASFTFNGNGLNQVIKARTTTTMPFTVMIKTFAAIQVISRLVSSLSLQSKVITVITIDGSFYAAGVDVPVKFDYDLKTQSLVSK